MLARAVRGTTSAALELLLPMRCSGCEVASSGPLCRSCVAQLREAAPFGWVMRGPPGHDVPSFAATSYEGVVRSALLDFKEHGRLALRHELGACLAVSLLAAVGRGRGPVVVVPVPSSRKAVRGRGHDPVASLARTAAAHGRAAGLGLVVRNALAQRPRVADQAGLDLAARRANLAGGLRVSTPSRVAGRRVIVVDDIVTTGATALEATRALLAAGAVVEAVACVAATPRRFPSRGFGLRGAGSPD